MKEIIVTQDQIAEELKKLKFVEQLSLPDVARALLDDYSSDSELTVFTSIDGEDYFC